MRYPATHQPLELARALVKLPNSSPLRYLSSYSDITCAWLGDCWTGKSTDPGDERKWIARPAVVELLSSTYSHWTQLSQVLL